MASDLNSVSLIGRLTADPQMSYLPTGMPVVTFSIANNYYVQNKENEVNYFDITAFGKLAETVNTYLRKGKQIAVHGTIRQERWQDKETGGNRSKIKIIMRDMQMLGGRDGENAAGASYQPQSQAPKSSGNDYTPPPMPDSVGFDDEDDVPF